MSASHFPFGRPAVKPRSARLPGAGVVSPPQEPYPRRSGACAPSPSPATIPRTAFSETRVRGMALTLRYPYPPSEAANAPAARTRGPAYLSAPGPAWRQQAAARRDAGQACHRAGRTRRPQPVDQQGLPPVRQAPQAGTRAEQFGGPLPPHAARQRTYDILSPSLQENVRTLLSGWASMAETKGRECG